MKISEAINAAAGNMARPTKFNAEISIPLELTATTNESSFDIMCKTVGVPETVMEPIDILFKGHNLKIPGRVNQQQEITIVFYLDEYHHLRKVFYDWINALDERFYGNKNSTSAGLWSSGDFFGSITLKTRDFAESLNTPMDYYFENIYPTNVGGVEFSTGGINEVMEFTVTFTYTKFSHINSNPEIIDDIDNILDGGY